MISNPQLTEYYVLFQWYCVEKTVFCYVRVFQNTHCFSWFSCFCLIHLKMSLKIAIYIKLWYTFSFFFRLFYIITYWWLNMLCTSLRSFNNFLSAISFTFFIPSKIFLTISFLELVKIVRLCFREKFLTQLICLIVTCALLRLKTTEAIFFPVNFFIWTFGITHRI